MDYSKQSYVILFTVVMLGNDISLSIPLTSVFGKGFCLSGTPFSIARSIGPGACLKDCSEKGQCLSANYWLDNFVCEFFSTDSTDNADYFHNSECIHYSLESENSRQEQELIGKDCPVFSSSVQLWSGETACIATECPEPSSYGNVLVFDGGNTINSQRQCECKTKYTTVPADDITCQPSQNWTPESTCTVPIIFSFEGSDLYSFVANYPWDRNSGSTYSLYTGPSGAFDGSYYMYYETSVPIEKGRTEEMISEIYFTAEIKCLEFYFSMYGTDIGTLTVKYIEEGSSEKYEIWHATGDRGTDEWIQAKIPLNATNNFKLIFEASDGGDYYYGDIAIDYIVLSDAC